MMMEALAEKTDLIDDLHRQLSEYESDKEGRRKEIDFANQRLAIIKVSIRKAEGENSDLDKDMHTISLDIKRLNQHILDKSSKLSRF